MLNGEGLTPNARPIEYNSQNDPGFRSENNSVNAVRHDDHIRVQIQLKQ